MEPDDTSLPVRPYHATFVVDHRTISLLERSRSDYASTFEVVIDQHLVGEISFVSPFLPSIGFSSRQVVLWGHTDLYAIDLDSYLMTVFPQNEPVHAAYPIDHAWCLIRELSVVIADVDRKHLDKVFDHNEVIVASWWESNRLYVEDFEHRRFVFELSGPRSHLTHVDIATE